MKRTLCILSVAALTACATPPAPNPEGDAVEKTPPADDAAPQADAAAAEVDVTFPADGLELAGTMGTPEGFGPDAKAPAVVFVHGSGPNARDEVLRGQLGMGFAQPVSVFKDLARSLQSDGFVTLRYDKRTCGPFNGCADNGYPTPPADILPTVFIDDAHAARAFLASTPGVDASRIVYVGHSQGGALGLDALARGGFAGGILLAANYSPIDAIIAQQRDRLADLLEQSGAPRQAIDVQTGPLNDWLDGLARIRAGGDDAPEAAGGGSAAFWTDHFAIAARRAERIAALDTPVHLIFGGYDWNVPPSEADLWQEALASAPEGVETSLIVLPDVTHALNRIAQPDFTKIQVADIGTSVDGAVLAMVSKAARSIVGD
jgi:pimeloyl-ACP methyl ester carboxylesterase